VTLLDAHCYWLQLLGPAPSCLPESVHASGSPVCRRSLQRCSCSETTCSRRPARSRSRCGAPALRNDFADVERLCRVATRVQVEGLQAALAAKDRRIEDLRSTQAAHEAQCQALQAKHKVPNPDVVPSLPCIAPCCACMCPLLGPSDKWNEPVRDRADVVGFVCCNCSDLRRTHVQELESMYATAQKDLDTAQRTVTELRMLAKTTAERASDMTHSKDAEIAELHARLHQTQVRLNAQYGCLHWMCCPPHPLQLQDRPQHSQS
jgi:hypothetical protein